MKTVNIGDVKIIMSNPHSKHNYFAWPTVTRLQNGKIAVVASGYRLRHVCPFGKMVISYSENEGETYTAPAPIIDTPLDDRDGGILAFGERDVIVTSFTNTVEFQRKRKSADAYNHSYLDKVTPKVAERNISVQYIIALSHPLNIFPKTRQTRNVKTTCITSDVNVYIHLFVGVFLTKK